MDQNTLTVTRNDPQDAAAGIRITPIDPAQEYTLARIGGDLPAWLAGADQEERAELDQLGVTDDGRVGTEAERDALVSHILRAVTEHQADIQRFDGAEQLEHNAITARYDRLRAPAKRQLERLGAFLLHIISSATFTKGKSRHVGWGTYGLRKAPDAITVDNEPAALDWLAAHRPDLVHVDVTLTLAAVRSLLQHADNDPRSFLQTCESINVLRDQVDAKAFGYSKTQLKALVLGGKGAEGVAVPGVTATRGEDRPFFKAEAPDAGSVPAIMEPAQ